MPFKDPPGGGADDPKKLDKPKPKPTAEEPPSSGRLVSLADSPNGRIFVPNEVSDDDVTRQTPLGARWLSAQTVWEASNLWVEEGQTILVTYQEYYFPGPAEQKPPIDQVLWKMNPAHSRWYGAAGKSGTSVPNGYALPGAPEGSLVWRIGKEGPGLPWGKQVVDRSGEIFLTTNDDIHGQYGKGFSDNSGRIHVWVYRY